jgi:XTP/dITP diphosphohydrolase
MKDEPLSASPRKIVVATGNRKKGIEMAEILGGMGLEILTLSDFPGAETDVPETGTTYLQNAEIKAKAAVLATGLVSIADDAGLEIDALGGEPGLHSKRFLGEDTPFDMKMQHILEKMKAVPDEKRGCRFNCAVVIATPIGQFYQCTGVCEGRIAYEMRGSFGFGYDPIFYLPELGKHMAELHRDEKHKISHRGKALACARAVLARIFP